MPARLNPLGNDGVDARRGGRLRLLNRTDLDKYANPPFVRGLDVGRRIAPEQNDHRHVRLGRCRDLLPQLLSIFRG